MTAWVKFVFLLGSCSLSLPTPPLPSSETLSNKRLLPHTHIWLESSPLPPSDFNPLAHWSLPNKCFLELLTASANTLLHPKFKGHSSLLLLLDSYRREASK